MSRIFILTDLEGPAGVYKWSQTREEGPLKERAMHLLTLEVNACVEGILAADPGAQIIAWDGHGTGGLHYEALHPNVQYLPGTYGRPYLFPEGFDALFFVGQHAMAGTPQAPLCHTYSSRSIEYYRLNGRPIGEFGCRAALAGSYGIPTLFLAGDDQAVREAKQLVPDLVGVATKRGLGIEAALHLSPARSREQIRAAATEAMGRIRWIPPYRVAGPYALEIRYLEEQQGRLDLSAWDATWLDTRTALLRSETLDQLPI